MTTAERISAGAAYLGIELGSTRIKASLIGEDFLPLASGSYEWENQFENGYWTYSLEEIHRGVKGCYADLSAHVQAQYGVVLASVRAIGVSGMMHGLLAFDKNWNLLTPFRTWRNTVTGEASEQLTDRFHFHIPQRWSIAHLYQAMLNGEEHVSNIAYLTTLAGYVHRLLTGRHELGVGEASGMFPIQNGVYHPDMMQAFEGIRLEMGYTWSLFDLLPRICHAGQSGAMLTEEGARFLDPAGNLMSGIPLCPPEGDAGTGMVATNSVRPQTGNVSAGTSVFAMLVLEKPLCGVYPEIDVAATPDGADVAMVHCNNGCGELDAWIRVFGEFFALTGQSMDRSDLYDLLYRHALSGESDCGGVVAYNYLSGEHITGVETGFPMLFRMPGTKLTLANLWRAELSSALAVLQIGIRLLIEQEKITVRSLRAHGGLFKVKGVASQLLANATGVPVTVATTASEGGAWGMALLAAYMIEGAGQPLADWLDTRVFGEMESLTAQPDPDGTVGFGAYLKRYQNGLDAEKRLGDTECWNN